MNYANIKCPDIANGLGCRATLFVSGCEFHCPGCFNAEAWDFKAGKPYTKQVENHIMDLLQPDYIQGLSVLGGEPLNPRNIATVLSLVKRVRQELPEKDVWIYTGYRWEMLIRFIEHNAAFGQNLGKLLPLVDVLVDGLFVEAKKDISLKFRGSSNQRLIRCKDSINNNENKIILLEL